MRTQVRASDIHIEPQEGRLLIRFRIDGVLHLQTEADSKIAPALVLRLKLMSGLDISEKRLPQDGRFNVRVREQRRGCAYLHHAHAVRRIGGDAPAEPGRRHARTGQAGHAAATCWNASARSSGAATAWCW